jgi:hypothetical protein
MPISLEKTLRVCALLAVAACLGMIGLFAVTGVGQDPLQYVHPPSEYARILLARPAVLRASIALDDAFIAFYAAVFASIAALLWRSGVSRALIGASMTALALLTLLDIAENFHFLTMIAQAEVGVLPSSAEIGLQAAESLVKFHVGYVGLFLLGFALPRATPRLRVLSNLSFVQLGIGVLLPVVPRALALPLVFARFTYFVAALLLVAFGLGAWRRASGSGAPASHPGTMLGAAG